MADSKAARNALLVLLRAHRSGMGEAEKRRRKKPALVDKMKKNAAGRSPCRLGCLSSRTVGAHQLQYTTF